MVPQRLYIEQWRENHSLIFATKGGGVGGVLFVVGVTSSEKIRSNGKKERTCRIIVDVTGRKWKKIESET